MTDLLTAQQAAARLTVHVSTLRRWTKRGRLPYLRITDGTIRYQASDVDALLSSSVRLDSPPENQPRSIVVKRQEQRGISSLTGLPFRAALPTARQPMQSGGGRP